MYEPTEREISLDIARTLHKIEQRLTWLLGLLIGVVVAVGWRLN